MSKKNTSIAAQALSEMDEIKSSLKEGSKSIISSLLNEAVKDYMRESIDDDEEEDAEDYEVLDADNDINNDDEEDTATASVEEEPAEEAEEVPEEGEAENPEGEEESPEEEDGDEWSEFDDYKVGDNEYDLTGVNDDETVVKVYKLLKDTDNVVVKKDGDKVQIQDKDTDAEYVIDLGDDEDPEAEETPEEESPMEEGCIKEGDKKIAGIPDEKEGEDGMTDQEKEWADQEDPIKSDHMKYLHGENKNSKKTMKESKEVIFEIDLGYTDNYQKEDPIEGLNNNEPSKSGKSWHKGVPTGTEKPWAGNAESEGEPFEKTVSEEVEEPAAEEPSEELEEATNVGGFVQQNSTSKSHIPNTKGRKARNASVAGEKKSGTADPRYSSAVSEQYEKKFKKALKENKELKSAVVKIKDALQEALIVNVNLGQFVKLVTENTTTQAEKIDILNRLNEAKTIEQSKSLYESIKRDLNKEVSSNATINEGSMKITESKNETEIYQSDEMLKMIDLNRKLNLL